MKSIAPRPTIASGTTAQARTAQPTTEQERALAMALFFVSGVSALVYEVAWVRLLNLTFGVSVYAVSTVLCVFMGGLALGSWLFGRRTARTIGLPFAIGASLYPTLRLYVALQLGIGLYALLTPLLFTQLTALYLWSSQAGTLDVQAGLVVRAALAALALFIPTTLMGGTLPALSQYLARRPIERGRDLGDLYTVNTFGAVLGTLITGIILIRTIGTDASIYLAAMLDLFVAGVALWKFKGSATSALAEPPASRPTNDAQLPEAHQMVSGSRKSKRATPRKSMPPVAAAAPNTLADQRSRARHARIALAGFTLSGFTALGYQVVWTRTLAIFSLNAVFSFTVMLATFLCGLALGSKLVARRIDRAQRPLTWLGALQIAIGTSALLGLFVFAKLPTLNEAFVRSDILGVLSSELAAAVATMLVPTLLMGAMFPVAARVYSGTLVDGGDIGAHVGRLYALNTLGAMLGSLIAGFVLIPLLGLQHATLALIGLNLLVGVAALLASGPIAWRARIGLVGIFAAVIAGVALLPPGIYLGFREGAIPQLKYYHEGVDATVAVFDIDNPPLKISFVNGRNEVPTDQQSMRAFYILGHLPALLQPNAHDALVVSFGNGIATGALASHPLQRITAVELVEGQIEAARLYRSENRNVLDDPRLTIIHEDGRNFLLRDTRRYDIITADATHPINSSSWALFTREFYSLVRGRLSSDGIFIQWLPFHDLATEDYRNIVGTFQSVFPNTTLFYSGGIHTFLVATPQPLTRAQISALEAAMHATSAANDLGSAAQLASDMLLDVQGVTAYTKGTHIVTDDSAFFLPAQNDTEILNSFAPYALR